MNEETVLNVGYALEKNESATRKKARISQSLSRTNTEKTKGRNLLDNFFSLLRWLSLF